MDKKVIVLANGEFPKNTKVLEHIDSIDFIICCDGSADKLLEYGKEPTLIIGDLDSVDSKTLKRYNDITHKIIRQDNTDLMKAFDWCIEHNIAKVNVCGATGRREDHTIGNIFVMSLYANKIDITMYTDTGYFVALAKPSTLRSYKGQQVSLFPNPVSMKLKTKGLRYAIENKPLNNVWGGTLNEALEDTFLVEFTEGVLLVFRTY